MPKTHTQWVCQNCGRATPREMGKCPKCGEFNTMVEVVVMENKAGERRGGAGLLAARPVRLSEIEGDAEARLHLPIEEFARVLGGGIVPGSVVLISGDPGIGKCVTGDTRVLDPITGAYAPITDWLALRRPVASVDDCSLGLCVSPVSEFHSHGQQPIVLLKTRLGRELRCTTSHPLLTENSWKSVGKLRPGDRIASPRCLPFFGSETMSVAEIKLLAYVISEGSIQSAIGVTSSLPEVAADLAEIAKTFEMRLVRYPKRNSPAVQYRFVNDLAQRKIARNEVAQALLRVKQQRGFSWADWARRANISYGMLNSWRRGECAPSELELRALATAAGCLASELALQARNRAEANTPIARFLERHGLRYCNAADKSIPACIFRLPRPALALFLRTLFTGDGSVFVNRRGLAGFSYSTISYKLAKDVQHLLLRFGVIATLRTKRQKVNGADYLSYELQGVGAKRTQAFMAEIGIVGRKSAQAALAKLSPEFDSSQADTVPTGEAFWTMLSEASGGLSFHNISVQAGVVIRNRRRERPLRRTTVTRLADAFPHPKLRALGCGDVYWDEIVSITAAGTAEVYDLTVPQHANFVANDLIVHNSTLMLQVAAVTAATQGVVLYVSGEESARQIKMRALRLAPSATTPGAGEAALAERLLLLNETNVEAIIAQAEALNPAMLIVDSIQTMYTGEIASAAGSVSQVRECAMRLTAAAKASGMAVFLIGHVTKEGAIAGPRVLEHIVDTVLYLEGDRFQSYRLLRGVKNRFGPTSEVGVFEMRGSGMVEVANPSEAFLAERMVNAAGSAIAVTMEGTRPLLVEVQALTSPTAFGNPRRTPNGVDFNRLLLVTAVLTKRLGLKLFDQDVFVNVIGGLQVEEPAADLAVAVAIASSVRDLPVAADTAFVGEIGLSGELRAVGQLNARLKEAAKLGFRRAIMPRLIRRGEPLPAEIEIIQARSAREAIDVALKTTPA